MSTPIIILIKHIIFKLFVSQQTKVWISPAPYPAPLSSWVTSLSLSMTQSVTLNQNCSKKTEPFLTSLKNPTLSPNWTHFDRPGIDSNATKTSYNNEFNFEMIEKRSKMIPHNEIGSGRAESDGDRAVARRQLELMNEETARRIEAKR